MRIIIFIFVTIIIFVTSCWPTEKIEDGWHGILPIKSTQTDVEQKLGSPTDVRGNYSTYETELAVINVSYSGEPCTGEDFGKWNVPRGTVLDMSIGPKADLFVSELNWDQNKYQKSGRSEIGENINLYNLKDHISINARVEPQGKELVTAIFYSPSEKYQHLKCK